MTQRNLIILVVVLAVIILVGGYTLFVIPANHSEPPGFASSTPAVSTTSPTPGANAVNGTPQAQGGSKPTTSIIVGAAGIKMTVDTSHAAVDGDLSPITLTLPSGSNGKVLVLELKPTGTTASTIHAGILLGTVVNTTTNTYNITGLSLSDMSDAATGDKTHVVPGTYILEVALWDRNPFSPSGAYNNFGGNVGTGFDSPAFTIAPAN